MTKSPVFVAVATATLGLGIGVNTTIFSFLNGMRFRQMPVKEPGKLVVITAQNSRAEFLSGISYPDYRDYRKLPVFEDAAACQLTVGSVHRGSVADRMWLEAVSGNYFSVLGINAARGRLFGESEERNPLLVLSYSTWTGTFGSDASIIGSNVRLNGQVFTVVGVTAKTFHGSISYLDTDGFVPVKAPGLLLNTDLRDHDVFHVLARLKEGVSVGEAQSAAAALGKNLEREYPETNHGMRAVVMREPDARPDPSATTMIRAMMASGFALVFMVLLIACANIANLLLVRTFNRNRELAIRVALGASRRHLISLLYAESLILAALGFVAGVLVSSWMTNLLSSYRPGVDFRWRSDYAFDGRVLIFTIAVTLFTALVCGTVPALQIARWDLNQVIKQSTGTPSSAKLRVSRILVIAQVTVSVVLLICSGLFVRGMANSNQIKLGYQLDNREVFSFNLERQNYSDTRAKTELKRMIDRIKTLPGVEQAAFVQWLPFGGISSAKVFREDEVPSKKDAARPALWNVVGPQYFSTMGTQFLRGREFSEKDDANSTPVAVVNHALADRLWPGKSAIGRRFRIGTEGEIREVVGVVETGKYFSLSEAPRPYYFVPLAQQFSNSGSFVVRSRGPQSAVMTEVRDALRAIDPELPVYGVMTVEHLVRDSYVFGPLRVGTQAAAAFGMTGLLLAAIGIYGVISYTVSTRTRDIGIRLSLGASRAEVLGMVMRQGLALIVCGIGAGIMGAIGLRGLLHKVVIGVSATDPITFATVTGLVILVGLLACYVPSRRAAGVDPVSALRAE